MKNIYERTSILIGEENLKKLNNSNVCVLGIGGVGSYVLEALARCGILNITIVDKDVVDATNINRQLIALNSTIGKDKVEIAKSRVFDINEDIKLIAIKENVTKENIASILNSNYDYIVDCVDNLEAKISIIEFAHKNNIRCISSMGMGRRINPLDIKICDINKTYMCPLAKKVRKILKELGIKKQKVVFSKEEPRSEKVSKTIGSISFVPSAAGLIIASEVVKDIINEEVNK